MKDVEQLEQLIPHCKKDCATCGHFEHCRKLGNTMLCKDEPYKNWIPIAEEQGLKFDEGLPRIGEMVEDTLRDFCQIYKPEPLKPCPFCGNPNIVIRLCYQLYYIDCVMCGATTRSVCNKSRAVELWNMRF